LNHVKNITLRTRYSGAHLKYQLLRVPDFCRAEGMVSHRHHMSAGLRQCPVAGPQGTEEQNLLQDSGCLQDIGNSLSTLDVFREEGLA
jgi:hypothetical protein